MSTKTLRTHTHWGPYDAEVRDGAVTKLTPIAADTDPSPIGAGMPQALKDQVRIAQPMVRLGWLENGPRKHDNRRGAEPFVPVSWERALDLVAGEVRRVRDNFGPSAIYAGSYGWASAGKFHLAQTHLRKFLNLLGGNVKSVNSYSLAAGDVVMQHVVGSWNEVRNGFTSWPVLAEHTRLGAAGRTKPHHLPGPGARGHGGLPRRRMAGAAAQFRRRHHDGHGTYAGVGRPARPGLS